MKNPDNMSGPVFFCGVGGSGMMPLALICKARGTEVHGSDRSRDQGKSPDKFQKLEAQGVILHPQDGSGLSADMEALVVSSAVEDSIPDVSRAKALGIPIIKRAELLAGLFNAAPVGVSIAGTSGKSSVTGMIATILEHAGLDPTVMNGGFIRNFNSAMRVGDGDAFVTETDESDGSIALYRPLIGVVNNIALDHKPLEELQSLFADFAAHTSGHLVINGDDPRTAALADFAKAKVLAFSLEQAAEVTPRADGIDFVYDGRCVQLHVPGHHNVMNALAALKVAEALGIDAARAIEGLEKFTGIGRRLEVVGRTACGITVIDDFAHNPDKIAASLQTLKQFDGRLFVLFQPHGYGPMRLLGAEIAESFTAHLNEGDVLRLTEPFYAGGTTEKDDSVRRCVHSMNKLNAQISTRDEFVAEVMEQAQEGDRIVIMGARDDTLHDLAVSLFDQLENR